MIPSSTRITFTAALAGFLAITAVSLRAQLPGQFPPATPPSSVRVPVPAQAASTPEPARLTVTRLFTGADGETHAEEVQVAMGPYRAGASFSDTVPAANIRFLSRPGPVVEEWHSAPRKQYAITLSGEAEMEIGGGNFLPLLPGSVLLIEDTSGKGHRVHVYGKVPWVAAFVPVADAPAPAAKPSDAK